MDIKAQKILAQAITDAQNSGTKPYMTTAKVHSITDGVIFVKFEGSDIATPVKTSLVSVAIGDEVNVSVSHSDTHITGNRTSPAMNENAVGNVVNETAIKMEEFIAANYATINNLKATNADIDNLKAGVLTADSAIIKELQVETAKIKDLESDSLTANSAVIKNLQADNVEIKETLTANEADIKTLQTDMAAIGDLEAKYANIDFSNIGKAAMEYFYAQSGLIKNVVVGDQTITGDLVGVTISGDLVKANTLKAEKLVIKGTDGLYYKLNIDAMGDIDPEKVPDDGLHGSAIIAKSITADKVSVSDLVAFGATIGGFKITKNSLYSGVKESADNTTRGVFVGNDGQFAIGDANQYLKYYKDAEGAFHLDISAKSFTMSNGENLEDTLSTAMVSSYEEYSTSESPYVRPTEGWSNSSPEHISGSYVWRRVTNTYADGSSETSEPILVTGNSGEDAVLLRIESSRGTVFKNNAISTVLSAVIYKGSKRITNITDLHAEFGAGAYLQWSWQKIDDNSYGVISSDDSMISDNGFKLTISADKVDSKVNFMCKLIT